MRLSAAFIRSLLLSGRAGTRLLNETAVQLEVWAAFAQAGRGALVDVLVTPMHDLPAARLAAELYDRIYGPETPRSSATQVDEALIFPLEGFVALKVNRGEFLHALLPLTGVDLGQTLRMLDALVRSQAEFSPDRNPTLQDYLVFAAAHRTVTAPDLRVGLLYLLMMADEPASVARPWDADVPETRLTPGDLTSLRDLLAKEPDISVDPQADAARGARTIWQIALNRPVAAMGASAATVKGDAARRLFNTTASHLTWAVIDSGIDGSHPAFRAADGFSTRVTAAYDFTQLRALAAFDLLMDPARRQALVDKVVKAGAAPADAVAWLTQLHAAAAKGKPYDWEVLSRVLKTPSDTLVGPDGGKPNGHGTHVAGVLAGDWRENDKTIHAGVCPDLRLIDLRVLGDTVGETEFAVIAALEFVRWTNGRNRYLTIHGVNLSIGLEHDVRNFACGQTPVCRACDATVRAGVVVVAAAGNWGLHHYATSDGDYQGYAAISIADPGNTESVITVGATHRDRPHEYGVSFFSSRGPTGDGRSKPDLVAPGERIDGPLPDLGFGRLDGTSMAAPHVSGVAALLMARHPELVGQPMKVKAVLMATATDLGRERHFQGAGLVDALRALQSQ